MTMCAISPHSSVEECSMLVALGNFNLFCIAVNMDKTKNAPGAMIKIEIGS